MVISLSMLFVLFGTTPAFAHMGDKDSGKAKGMMHSGMMKGSGTGESDKTESDESGHKGCPKMSSGTMGSGMMKGMMGSGMMKGMKGSGMMKKCRGMMGSYEKDGGIQTLINHRDKMNLTDEQVADLKSLNSSLVKETIRNKADLQIAEMDLGELLSKDVVKMPLVESKLKQIQNLQTQIRLSRIKAQLKARALLDEGQRKDWKS